MNRYASARNAVRKWSSVRTDRPVRLSGGARCTRSVTGRGASIRSQSTRVIRAGRGSPRRAEGMNAKRIVQAAIPNATDSVIAHVLWGRTPYPCGRITAQLLYRAASAWRRACEKGLRLCDFCHRVAEPDKWTCTQCREGFERCRREVERDSADHTPAVSK